MCIEIPRQFASAFHECPCRNFISRSGGQQVRHFPGSRFLYALRYRCCIFHEMPGCIQFDTEVQSSCTEMLYLVHYSSTIPASTRLLQRASASLAAISSEISYSSQSNFANVSAVKSSCSTFFSRNAAESLSLMNLLKFTWFSPSPEMIFSPQISRNTKPSLIFMFLVSEWSFVRRAGVSCFAEKQRY